MNFLCSPQPQKADFELRELQKDIVDCSVSKTGQQNAETASIKNADLKCRTGVGKEITIKGCALQWIVNLHFSLQYTFSRNLQNTHIGEYHQVLTTAFSYSAWLSARGRNQPGISPQMQNALPADTTPVPLLPSAINGTIRGWVA